MKQRHITWSFRLGFSIFTIICIVILNNGSVRAEIDPYFKRIVDRLHQSGFDPDWLDRVFDQPCIEVQERVLRLRLTVRESKIDYDQFLGDDNIRQAGLFMDQHRPALELAEEKYQVPKEVITAILLLETRLGTYTGKFQTLSTLATHAAAGQPDLVTLVYNRLPPEEKQRWSPQSAAKRLGNRTDWSFGELKAFLRYLRKTGAHPCDVNGSYTGAIGICQFQPSNIEPYGRDGNHDGVVDLFQVEDAIMSAAAYLHRHGWRAGLLRQKQLNIVKTYNHSTPYAQTILAVADKLKDRP
jgi:membrane-bound lytic murein transglycosylase B